MTNIVCAIKKRSNALSMAMQPPVWVGAFMCLKALFNIWISVELQSNIYLDSSFCWFRKQFIASYNEITTNDANLKTVDIMLKYDLVTPKTVEQLVILDKLKGVKGIDAVIAKYK